MSYQIEKTGDIVIKGFENGIADDPYQGISDMRNLNIISIPTEASVGFSTATSTAPAVLTGTIVGVNAGTETITFSGASGLESGMAVVFSGSLPTGLTAGTTYWVQKFSAVTFKVYNDLGLSDLVDLTTTTTGGTFDTFTMNQPNNFSYDSGGSSYWLIDTLGQVWTNLNTTTSGYWVYAGNSAGTGGWGAANGIVYYQASSGDRYLFVFRSSAIDYTRIELNGGNKISNTSWKYGWNPADGTLTNTNYLKTSNNSSNSHEALLAPDNKVYYCDANWIGRWYQADPAVAFVPTTPRTYVFDQTAVLPFNDICQCLNVLGNNLYIGGKKNVVYPWNTFSQLPTSPIFVAESNIVKLVTVNTNIFIFAGSRGRIYVTNGAQASLFKKVPDHISGTVEPYFAWGGASSIKNQLYFSALVTTNASVAVTQYGGVWGLDLDTKAIRLTNKLSYGTYAGYATAIIPNFGTNPAGTGLFIGWNSGASTYGVDATSSTPYTGGQATVDSDLIPIGTFLKPTTNGRLEFKLAAPLVSGESVQLYYRQKFTDSFTAVTDGLFNTAGIFSGAAQSVSFEQSQWLQVRAVLTSTASSPSYTRLTELRIGQ